MNTKRTLAAVALTGALVATTAACSVDDDDRCRTSVQYVPMFFSTVDHHYHYGSPTGKLVPANKVPSAARKVPNYKPWTPPKAPVNKTPKAPSGSTGSKPGTVKQPPAVKAPAPAPKAPAPAPAPAPRPRIR
jgi:hypothetical protein